VNESGFILRYSLIQHIHFCDKINTHFIPLPKVFSKGQKIMSTITLNAMNMQSPTLTDLKSSKEAKGKRLKAARMQAGLTRADIERKYNISKLTQGNWENGKAGGLTEKGAKRMTYAFKQEGLYCTIEWLLDGMGTPPYPTDKLFIGDEVEALLAGAAGAANSIAEELLTFRRCNKEAIDFTVQDEGMLPFYSIGDYVGGIQRYGLDIQSVIGRDCIMLLPKGKIMFRRLREGENGLYALACINPDANVDPFFMDSQEVISAAPVIWHRRCDF
jgi:transcriptional regulator with XRE-family HTH domain